MKRLGWAVLLILTAALIVFSFASPPAPAQGIFQYGFETRDPIWVKGAGDANFKETAHRLTEDTAHNGQRSEFIEVEAQSGTFIHYTYDVGKAPVVDELNVSLWVKSDRPGIQLLCRVVLKNERDPRNLDQLLTILVPGDKYQMVGRWQQLSLRQPVKRLREQQQLLQAARKRDVIIADAYVDQLVLNVYGGPGTTRVWTDDLVVGPLDEVKPATPTASAPGGGGTPAQLAVNQRAAEVRLVNNQLLVSGQNFFLRAVRHTGTPLKTLHDAGFNTVWLDESTPPGLVEDAVNLGFWVMPALRPPDLRTGVPGTLVSRDSFNTKVSFFLRQEAVLCWDLGTDLSVDQFTTVSSTAKAFRTLDPMRPVSVDVRDGFHKYSMNVKDVMLGIHCFPLMTSMDLTGYRDWLTQHRYLGGPGYYYWTWIQTHLPDWYVNAAYEKPALDTAREPLGPQAEQIKLLAYTAIGAGYRGLGFWSDRFLSDPLTGRDRLLALALLNQELQMLEPLLASADEPQWIDTSVAQVKAVVLRSEKMKATLVIPIWLGAGAQYVPGQESSAAVEVVVPHVPNGCLAWEVSPGDVRSLKWERVVGGVKITLREFSMTAAVVFTTDLSAAGLVVRFQDLQRRESEPASRWAYDQALEELRKVEQVETELGQLNHRLPADERLLAKAREYLKSAAEHRRSSEWAEAYNDAQRALRPIRILMRAEWEEAVKKLTTPEASPYALSFFTLPRHWRLWEEVEKQRFGANVLTDGDFELPPNRVQQGWLRQDAPSPDDVIAVARREATEPHAGKQCLMLQVKPRDPAAAPAVLERTFVAIHTPAVKLAPGTLVRISAWARLPGGIAASSDGALLYDSAGGEQLAVRLRGAMKWRQFTLYRRVPASGTINVTMALTGIGTVYFDDVRIEPAAPGDAPRTALNLPAR
jgi:hypothetical protein